MFEQWKKAWRDAVANFWRELDRAPAGAPPAARSAAMRRDVQAARTELDRVEADLARTRRQLAEEHDAEQSCRRRETLAREIGDDETARVAAEFATRHAERAGVLDRKARALEAEFALRRRDAEEMESALRDVAAAAGLDGGEGVPGREGVAGGARGDGGHDGAHEPDAELGDRTFRRMEREQREREAERRLEELKRKMR